MPTFFADARDAGRSLLQQPRVLIVASLTLALGIGAVTAIFSIVNGVLLTPLPYANADRLVNLWSTAPGLNIERFRHAPNLFQYFRDHNTTFVDLALFSRRRVNVTEIGTPEALDAAVVTQTYFSTLGVAFSVGRPFSEAEDRPDGSRVAGISHRLWTRRYGGLPATMGRQIQIDGVAHEVIGITPAALDQPGSPDVWLPARFNTVKLPNAYSWFGVGRLKPGITREQAAADLQALVPAAVREALSDPADKAFVVDGKYRPLVRDLREETIGSVRQPLWILLGTVGMVLLIACGNVANLCLVRAESRQREFATHLALGCSRARLIRRQLAEAMWLSGIGTVLGLAASAVGLPLLLQLAPDTIPRLDQVRLDARVLALASGAGVIATLIVGVFPAIRYSRPALLACLRQGGRSGTDQPGHHRGRNLLVVAQTAMAVVMLVGSGLLARSFSNLMGAEWGFDTKDVLTFQLTLTPAKYPKPADVAQATHLLLDRLVEIPSVESAGATVDLPLARNPTSTPFELEGQPIEAGKSPPLSAYSTVSPGLFKAIQVALVRGEGFSTADLGDGMPAVLVNQLAAAKFWPGQDAIGKRLRPAESPSGRTLPWSIVKGIVADVKHEGLRLPPRSMVYMPLSAANERTGRTFSFAIRGPRALSQVEMVRETVAKLDPDMPLAAVQPMARVVEQSVKQFSFTLLTLSIAAGIALVLGSVGLYGVLSYAVSLRTREIGVRIALGAEPGIIKRAILLNAAAITAAGLVIGGAAATGLTRLLGSLLYETDPLDPGTLAAAALLLLAVSLLAAYLPARRAASVSPVEAMRGD